MSLCGAWLQLGEKCGGGGYFIYDAGKIEGDDNQSDTNCSDRCIVDSRINNEMAVIKMCLLKWTMAWNMITW